MAVILVSACLLGCRCRYGGDHCENKEILSLASAHTLVGVCPEQLGGLPTPRVPAEIRRSGDREKVINRAGEDVTDHYRKGAEEVLRLARLSGAGLAILKAKSPACGKGRIYDGSFCGDLTGGNGVAAALLLQGGIPVFTEEEMLSVRVFLAASAKQTGR